MSRTRLNDYCRLGTTHFSARWNFASAISSRASHECGEVALALTQEWRPELCVLLEGRVRLSSAEGSVEFEEGDAFVIAPGFRGSWESIGRVTKVYAVLDPSAGA